MIFFMSMCLLSEMSTWFSSQGLLKKHACAARIFSLSLGDHGEAIESPPLRLGECPSSFWSAG